MCRALDDLPLPIRLCPILLAHNPSIATLTDITTLSNISTLRGILPVIFSERKHVRQIRKVIQPKNMSILYRGGREEKQRDQCGVGRYDPHYGNGVKFWLAHYAYYDGTDNPVEARQAADAYHSLFGGSRGTPREGSLLPDAFIVGFSADTGGFIPSYSVGAEDLYLFSEEEWEAFVYAGSGQGAGFSADVGAYAGFVWNLDCIECYSGEFEVLAIDASLFSGGEFVVFWSPYGETWGIALAGTGGASASVTYYEVDYIQVP